MLLNAFNKVHNQLFFMETNISQTIYFVACFFFGFFCELMSQLSFILQVISSIFLVIHRHGHAHLGNAPNDSPRGITWHA